MPWCPRCKSEYRDGFTICHYCDVKLVDKLPEPEKNNDQVEKESVGKVKPQPELENEVPLTTVDEEIKYIYITSQLEEMGILYRVMERGVGQYLTIYLGASYIGKTIYVERKDYTRALEVVYSFSAEAIEE